MRVLRIRIPFCPEIYGETTILFLSYQLKISSLFDLKFVFFVSVI